MDIAFFEAEAWEANVLLELYGDVDYDVTAETLSAKNVEKYSDSKVISVSIYSDLSRDILSKMKRLKMIATRSRTVDHIDLDYCCAHDIVVTNVPSYGAHTVAEHVFALLLSISRRIPEAAKRAREGIFTAEGLQGFDLRGQTLGVLGTGEVGIEVIRLAKAFGMHVLACDLAPRMDMARELDFTYTSFDRLLTQSDVLTLHVGGKGDIHHLIGAPQIGTMRQGVVIINTSRGDVIDPKALLAALHSGKVRAAGLDVLPEETAVKVDSEMLKPLFQEKFDIESVLADRALLQHPRVIVTPHTAYYTHETVRDILCVTGNNINAFLNRQPLVNLATKSGKTRENKA